MVGALPYGYKKGEDGKAVIDEELGPIVQEIKEITPPAGFASAPNAQTFTFDGSNTDVAVVEMEYTFEDMPTLVDVTKSSLTTGEELEGASLQVTDEDGNVIDSWTSGTEPHRITGLVVDKTYTLTETLPASGYATA